MIVLLAVFLFVVAVAAGLWAALGILLYAKRRIFS